MATRPVADLAGRCAGHEMISGFYEHTVARLRSSRWYTSLSQNMFHAYAISGSSVLRSVTSVRYSWSPTVLDTFRWPPTWEIALVLGPKQTRCSWHELGSQVVWVGRQEDRTGPWTIWPSRFSRAEKWRVGGSGDFLNYQQQGKCRCKTRTRKLQAVAGELHKKPNRERAQWQLRCDIG
jgi:hypothetical protein